MDLAQTIDWGDFSSLADHYKYRQKYEKRVLHCIARYVQSEREDFQVADIGAGTGLLTTLLMQLGLGGYAVEPNDAMREEGQRLTKDGRFAWLKGTAETANLPDNSVDWVCMANAFHWTDAPRALREFHRILRPGGHFSVVWNPPDLAKDALQREIQEMIFNIDSGPRQAYDDLDSKMASLDRTLVADGYFDDLMYIEGSHDEHWTPKHYMGYWRAAHFIPSQVTAEKWQEILSAIEARVAGYDTLTLMFPTRTWTVRAVPRRGG